MKSKLVFGIMALVMVTIGNSQTKVEEKTKKTDGSIPLDEKLQAIRENFKRLNAVANWSAITAAPIWDSAEGGDATYYFLDKNLEKIITQQFGETFQLLTEYYLKDGKLSFVFQRVYRYNRPIYNTEKLKEKYPDMVVFDFKKSKIVEGRSYFNEGKLIHQVKDKDLGDPFAYDAPLEDQKRILTDFKRLLKLEKSATNDQN